MGSIEICRKASCLRMHFAGFLPRASFSRQFSISAHNVKEHPSNTLDDIYKDFNSTVAKYRKPNSRPKKNQKASLQDQTPGRRRISPRGPKKSGDISNRHSKADAKHGKNNVPKISSRLRQFKSSDLQSKSQETHEKVLSTPLMEFLSKTNHTLNPRIIKLGEVVDNSQPPVPTLEHNLDRVLFSPGIHILKDQRTGVYNFDPSLESIMSIRDFDFTKVTPFTPSAQDTRLSETAKKAGKAFTSSTSSLTAILMQFHFIISRNRLPSIGHLSKSFFGGKTVEFTGTQRKPVSAFLRYRPETGTYSLDSDKTQDEEIILSLLGHVMETQLTTKNDEFRARFTKPYENENLKEDSKSEPLVEAPSTYHYSTLGDFVMRSQIDCYDPRLPGTGVFDLKTRAVCAVRHDLDYAQIHDGSNYQVTKIRGEWESYEREQFDLVRTALFKYSLQARIGRMDGIFIAYHNVRKMFGFEYLPVSEIDKVYHSTGYPSPQEGEAAASLVGSSEFKMSIEGLSKILQKVIEAYPKQSVNLVFKSPTTPKEVSRQGHGMLVFANPMKESVVDCLQRGLQPPAAPTKEEIELLKSEIENKANNDDAGADRCETPEYVVQASDVEHRAYLDRNSIADLYKNNYQGPLPGVKGWFMTFDNAIGGRVLGNYEHPTPKPHEDWTVDMKIKELSASSNKKLLDTVIQGYLDDLENFNSKGKNRSSAQNVQNDNIKTSEHHPLDSAIPRSIISAADTLQSFSTQKPDSEDGLKSSTVSKMNGRLTSTPDTVRRSQEEIAKYIETGLGRMDKPTQLQTILRKLDRKGKKMEDLNEMNSVGKEKIIWTPK